MAQRGGFRLDGGLAVVTGAGSGIGRATALALAGRGTRIVAVDIDDGRANDAAADCTRLGVDAWGRAADVASFPQLEALAQDVLEHHGVPDAVVNNAGVGMTGRFDDMTTDDWQWIRSVNLDGVVHGCMAFGPAMLRRGRGHIVNVSSGLGYTIRAHEPGYVTTKAAVLALSRCLHADWLPRGVGVTAICPGLVNTPIIESTRFAGSDVDSRRGHARKLFERGHQPETVATAIVAAIGSRRAVVPVGWEARLAWGLNRALPVSLLQRLARHAAV